MTQKPLMARCPDYQLFDLLETGTIRVESIGPRMKEKMKAIPIPSLLEKHVLDIGCDFGFWTILASNLGAKHVVGLDRGRPVNGTHVDLIALNREFISAYPMLKNCFFEGINIGKQWKEWGHFDVIFLFSLYHHIFENCGDHRMIWFWLWRHMAKGGELLWENPIDTTDGVSYGNISKDKHPFYTKELILGAAAEYFKIDYIGPARHEPTRHVYRFTPKFERSISGYRHIGTMESGAGGATTAFEHAGQRRCKEIHDILGFIPFPGSLNVRLDTAFDYGRDYYRGDILDVKERRLGFESPWEKRSCRFYPVTVNGHSAFAMRFEGEEYPSNFIELIAPIKLRDMIEGEKVTIERP